MDLAASPDHRVKLKESEMREKYVDFVRELKKLSIMKKRYSHKRVGTSIRGLGNKRSSGDYANYNIMKIGQNTEKSPGDLSRLVVTQTSLEHY